MADPISILSACDIAAKAAGKATKLAKTLINAPDELLALSNELWNFNLVLECVRDLKEHSSDSRSSSNATNALLYQAQIKLEEANTLVSQTGRLSEYGDTFKVGRAERFLWLKKRKQVAKLQAELRDLRTNLSLSTGAGATSSMAKLEIDMRKLTADCIRLFDQEQTQAADDRKTQEEFERSSMGSLNDIHKSQIEAKQVLMSMLDTMKKLDINEPVDKRFDNYIEPATGGNDTVATTSNLPNTPLAKTNRFHADPVFAAVAAGRVKAAQMCDPACNCHCHSRTNYQTPRLLQQTVGRLFLGYSGRMISREQCIATCHQHDKEGFQMTYFFPKWFLQRAVSISMVTGLMGSPTFNLKIRRLVPEMSQLFALSRYGDVDGLRSLFVNGLASPDDVHVRGGWTALHFAVDHGCIEVCKLLLDCGADPQWEDATGTTAVEIAWRNILHLRAPAEVSDTFSTLFPGSDFLQERRFTRCHRLIAGIEQGDLKQELETNPASVNAVDIDNWTPLHWAARRGNITALSLLLSHGADPHVVTENESRTALHLAAQGNSPACVERLLHYRRGNKVVDIEGRDVYGQSPIRVAIGRNCAAATAKLIQLGADLNSVDKFGESGLFSAVYENAHETITQVLKAGAIYTTKTTFDNTILHFAANEADAETISLLTRASLTGIDVDAKNSDGFTAHDLASQRGSGAPESFMVLFDRLLSSVSATDDDAWEAQSHITMSSAGESWKSFEDAIWYEADFAAAEDVREKASYTPSRSVSPSSLDDRLAAEGIAAEDKAGVGRRLEDMV